MKFSIIIPTYNSENFLKDCLNSLFYQNFQKNEYEIIVVDDASTQNTKQLITQILDSIKQQNVTHKQLPQLHFLKHEKNKRQGGGRNTGLRKALGDYIFFLDSDDYWRATNTLAIFNSILENESFDILRSVAWDNTSHDSIAHFESITYDSEIQKTTGKYYLEDDSFSYEVWLSCYKREFLLHHKLFFRENVVFEDSDWMHKVFWYADKIGVISFPFYIYRQNPESTTKKPRIDTFKDNITSLNAIEDFILSVNMPENCRKACYARIKKSILSYIRISSHYPISASAECFKKIRKNLLTETSCYDMSHQELILFKALLHAPLSTAVIVKAVTLTKRFLLKCLGK